MAEETIQFWQVIAGVCQTPGGEDATVYGLQVTADGTVWRWQDVAADRALVQQLADILQQTQPERCHWAELVEDYITGLYLEA